MFQVNRASLLGKTALLLAVGSAMYAQEVTGMMLGTVKDTQGKALAGAKVIIRAPQLIQPRTVQTDANGNFRAPLLPPGDYRVDVTSDRYIGQTASGVRLNVGASLRVDFTLKPMQAQAEVTVEVVATSGSMDKTDTKTQTQYSAEQLQAIPTPGGDKAFTAAVDLSPGVVVNAGGGTSIRGGTTQSTVFTVNGTSVTDEYQGDMTSTVLINDAVEDTQVIQSPLHARFGRTGGGIVNVVTKSGGNDFSGSARYYLQRDSWIASRPYQDERADAPSRRQFDIFLSGPIIKDRLWFAISTIQQPSSVTRYDLLAYEDPASWEWSTAIYEPWPDIAFGDARPYTGDIGKNIYSLYSNEFVNVKLTYAITADHIVDAAYNESTYTITNRNPYGVGTPIVMSLGSHRGSQVGLDKYWSVGYRGNFGTSTFVEARWAKSASETVFPAPNMEHIRWQTGAFGVLFPYGFNISPSPDGRYGQDLNLNVKHFLEAAGTHDIDIGFDWHEGSQGTSTQNSFSNSRFYVPWMTDDPRVLAAYNIGPDPNGVRVAFPAVNFWDALEDGFNGRNTPLGAAAVYQKYYGKDGKSKSQTTSFYLNDAWVINSNWNVMVGLRQDRFKVVDTDGSTLLTKTGALSPRLQVRYDPTGASTHVFTFTGAQYVQAIPVGYINAFIKQANSQWVRFGYVGVPRGTSSWVDYANIINPQNYDLTHPYAYSNTAYNSLRQDIQAPTILELTLGYRRSYKDGSFVGVNAVMKEWKNDFAVWQDADPSFYVTVPDPSGQGLPPIRTLGTKYGNSNLLKRYYKGLELEWRDVINSVWTFGGNYTWSRLTGNNNGGDSTGQSFRDNTVQDVLQLRQAKIAAGIPSSYYDNYGLLISDQTHKARIYVTASLPMGKGKISYSASLNYDSGLTFSAMTANPTAGWVPVAGGDVPSMPAGYNRVYGQRGMFRGNDSYNVNFKVDWAFPIFKSLQLMGDVQISNVFNTMQQVGMNAAFTNARLAPNVPIYVTSPAAFGTDNRLSGNYLLGRRVLASLGLKF